MTILNQLLQNSKSVFSFETSWLSDILPRYNIPGIKIMITIIDYKAGNLTSVELAIRHIGFDVEITDDPGKVLKAQRIIFPGVGAAKAAMENLRTLKLYEPIKQVIAEKIPFLGICIGMQLMFDLSWENDNTTCLGMIEGTVKKFQPSKPQDKIPHMGWNSVNFTKDHPVFAGLANQSEFYFVHSYYPCPANESDIIGKTDYADVVFASAVAKDNLIATQFHPERSGRIGLKLLENFCNWNRIC